jgi:integrase
VQKLRWWPKPSHHLFIYLGTESNRKQGRVFDTTNIRKEWTKACAALGLGRIIAVEGRPYDPRYEALTLHDFRRSAIRNLVTLAGVREKVAMESTGHKTRSVFDRYHIVDTQEVSNAMQQWESVASQYLLSQRRESKLGKSSRQPKRKSLMALSSRG